jgi:crossover junction endodeoxyribonuclease RuvC
VRVFGIDPGCERTGYGCVETDGSRHRIVVCGAITSPAVESLPDKLQRIHHRLVLLIKDCQPASVAIENLFFSVNVRSALKLGHARGVAMLAAVEAGLPVFEYTPAEVKRAVVGYGRADKPQVQHMVRLLLGLDAVPTPHDAADALAIAICHVHSAAFARGAEAALRPGTNTAAADGNRRAVQPSRSKATSWSAFVRERDTLALDPLRRDRRGKPARS